MPFMAVLDPHSLKTTRLWQSRPPMYENIASFLSEDETGLPEQVILRRESTDLNPNYHISDISSGIEAIRSEPDEEKQKELLQSLPRASSLAITTFKHPAPDSIGTKKEYVTYERADGVKLNAQLYLPANYNPETDGPIPLFMWAYPREFKDAAFAGQKRDSPHRFSFPSRVPLYWLTMGYAILDGPAFPIVGQGDEEPNDTFLEQLVASAQAAVDYVVSRGVTSRDTIAIGGHSYGAFMTANLLAHAPGLFACGVAQSGAYNRSLTPFGFQSEERTMWEVPEVYTKMSPYFNAHKIQDPLLLIHGDADTNPGTLTLQSERMFQAMKGHGKVCKFVNLPFEQHGYRGYESVMHSLAEVTEWLDTYCKK